MTATIEPSEKSNTPFSSVAALPKRLASLDAYRGFVMLLMMGEIIHLSGLAQAWPSSKFWHFLALNQEHVDWVGCTLHDLIQPSFSFLVGVALPFSIASRAARGESPLKSGLHALWRALLLILLGVFLRSTWGSQTYWTFEDTLTQIGLGYPFLFLLGFHSTRTQWITLGVILVGYWAAWAMYPVAEPNLALLNSDAAARVGHEATGFAAHWNKNANLGAAFDRWFLNLFPRAKPFVDNSGGYLTLSFIPTLGTMILGLIAGGRLRREETVGQKVNWFVLAGAIGIGLGLVLNTAGVCPLVKRIWTPTWTIFSGGCCFLLLALFFSVIDGKGWKRWAFPLVVVGMNSIAAYCLAWLMYEPVSRSLKIHLGADFFSAFGAPYARTFQGICVLTIYWLILFWMYRRKIFLKI